MLFIGSVMMGAIVFMAVFANLFPGDPMTMVPTKRLAPAGGEYPLGTDALGRDVLARTVHGARVSLMVGLLTAFLAIAVGLVIGLISGYFRRLDGIIMRVMDSLMAIPTILLAISLVAITQASVSTVIIAIAVPEVPRVVRLVRSIVLGVRDLPYVEAAVACGSGHVKTIVRHILPSTVGPLIVQGAYVCANSILLESALSFLGAGSPPDIPSWGNMIASSRLYLSIAPWTIFAPGICLALTILSVNLVGDGLRDRLDPQLSRRM